MSLTYLLNVAWMAITSFCAMPIIIYLMLRSVCANEIEHRDYWFLDNYCLNLSRFGLLPNLFFTLLNDILVLALVLQQNRLRWYGHVLRKEDDDWVKKCMEYEVEGPRPRGRSKRTWREVVRENCQARKINKEDAIDRCKWRKMIKDVQ